MNDKKALFGNDIKVDFKCFNDTITDNTFAKFIQNIYKDINNQCLKQATDWIWLMNSYTHTVGKEFYYFYNTLSKKLSNTQLYDLSDRNRKFAEDLCNHIDYIKVINNSNCEQYGNHNFKMKDQLSYLIQFKNMKQLLRLFNQYISSENKLTNYIINFDTNKKQRLKQADKVMEVFFNDYHSQLNNKERKEFSLGKLNFLLYNPYDENNFHILYNINVNMKELMKIFAKYDNKYMNTRNPAPYPLVINSNFMKISNQKNKDKRMSKHLLNKLLNINNQQIFNNYFVQPQINLNNSIGYITHHFYATLNTKESQGNVHILNQLSLGLSLNIVHYNSSWVVSLLNHNIITYELAQQTNYNEDLIIYEVACELGLPQNNDGYYQAYNILNEKLNNK